MSAAELRIASDTAAATTKTMHYMVVERFKEGAAPQIYQRLRDQGRMMPRGLEYVSSWIDMEFTVCYQLMRTGDPTLFSLWIDAWKDLIDFEIVPVRTSTEAVQIMTKQF